MPLLRQLQYFVAVAEELHFGRAARRLMITQPGLSQQIKSLERKVGVPLLVREKRTLELTRAGVSLLGDARLLIALTERATEAARAAVGGKSGLLKVGTTALGTDALAEDLFREFQRRYGHVNVEFHPTLMPQPVTDLEQRKIDVALILAPFLPLESANYLQIGAVEPMVAVPLGHRLSTLDRVPRARLLRETFLDWPRSFDPPIFDMLHERLFGDDTPRRSIEVPDLSETSRLARVATGEGITVTICPSLNQLQIANVAFRRFEDPVPKLEYGIAWFDDATSPFVKPFVDVAREFAATARGSGGARPRERSAVMSPPSRRA